MKKQSIEDGVLIDVSKLAKTVGFKCPVAITSKMLDVIGNIPEKYKDKQNYVGRLWDVLYIGYLEAKQGGSEIFYRLIMHHDDKKFLDVKMVCGPMGPQDPMEAITIMLPHED